MVMDIAKQRREKLEREIERRELASQVMDLRLAGYSYAAIARLLNLTSREVKRIIERELNKIQREPAELLLQLELDRLDALMRAYWDAAIAGDGEAADRILRIMDRRARYLGLDRQEAVQEDLGRAVLSLVSRLKEVVGQDDRPALPSGAIDVPYDVVEVGESDAIDAPSADGGAGEGVGDDE